MDLDKKPSHATVPLICHFFKRFLQSVKSRTRTVLYCAEVTFLDCGKSHFVIMFFMFNIKHIIIRQDREVPLTYNDVSTEMSC